MNENNSKLDDLRIDRTESGPKRSNIWILAPVLFAGLAAGVYFWKSGGSESVLVRSAVARETGISNKSTVLNASGYVTARRKATVSSKVTGKVVELFIEEGMKVEKGQLLALLDSSNVRKNLGCAKAKLEVARAALKETKVRLQEAGRDLKRVADLARQGAASKAELDTARSECDALDARLSRQKSEINAAQKAVDLWNQQLKDREIRAPFSGVVVSKSAQPGEMISPISAGGGFIRTGVGTIVDMSSLEIEVDVSENYIKRVVPDQPVEATLDAYPEWNIPARVIAIVPTADRKKATVRVRIGFEKIDARVLPDMGVNVAFKGVELKGRQMSGVVIPRAAVRRQDGYDVVFVIKEGRAGRRAVTLGGPLDTDEVILASGVSAGERVVVDCPGTLEDGDRVTEVRE